MATVLCEEQVEIPPGIDNLADFRRWALSDDFPERGRIDYVAGRIEVDMSPEDLFTHGTLKAEVAGEIKDRVQELDLGHIFIAESRASSVPGDVSAEPDVVVITFEAEDEGRVRYTPKASKEEGRFVEIDGAPDLIVEIISDSSKNKDTKRLPPAYYAAGVRELWLVDARGKRLYFQIFHRGRGAFEPTPADEHAFQASQVLQASYHLERVRHRRGHWVYRLSQSESGREPTT
jgi:Uma2 family endonuclease